jgi:hypothetical protein
MLAARANGKEKGEAKARAKAKTKAKARGKAKAKGQIGPGGKQRSQVNIADGISKGKGQRRIRDRRGHTHGGPRAACGE